MGRNSKPILLWQTWFLVTMFDVRYLSDSIFARTTRAIQLGVLIGFAVVAPKFDIINQHANTFRTMSLILMVSRITLVVEYCGTLWHVRKYNKAHYWPLIYQMSIHLTSAIFYLGLCFTFYEGMQSRSYMAWYFISSVEMLAVVLMAYWMPVLGVDKTHIMKRITLLTVMIMGDSIAEIAKTIVTIVKNPESWDRITISVLTAAVVTIYFIFLTYFDWLRESFYLPPLRLQFWIILHLPFHLAMVFFTHGLTQFLLWSKIIVQYHRLESLALSHIHLDTANGPVGPLIQRSINETVQTFFADYPPASSKMRDQIDESLRNISNIPEGFWHYLNKTDDPSFSDPTEWPAEYEDISTDLGNIFNHIFFTMMNSMFGAFGIDIPDDSVSNDTRLEGSTGDIDLQIDIFLRAWELYQLIFAYGYLACSCAIILMALLAIAARTAPYKPWQLLRFVIVFLLAIGVGLVSVLWYDKERVVQFLNTAWVLPAITLVWTAVMILTHVNGEGVKRNFKRFRNKT
ncbi:hypothetical protein CP532_6452 [Ophiocordyceps camponoti-leonardi (nom. inval.)]|nr:hypothetical protein CP532_6452 [Ophiocordyceps camponoti-leonardi (nom. inval.)]